jgi:hypothetical protein
LTVAQGDKGALILRFAPIDAPREETLLIKLKVLTLLPPSLPFSRSPVALSLFLSMSPATSFFFSYFTRRHLPLLNSVTVPARETDRQRKRERERERDAQRGGETRRRYP